jgi:hypothetical protein
VGSCLRLWILMRRRRDVDENEGSQRQGKTGLSSIVDGMETQSARSISGEREG